MRLTVEEKRMLSGREGSLLQEAMRFLVSLGEAYDASRMVDITYANIILGSSFWGKGVLTRELVDQAVHDGLRVRVPTTFNNWGLWDKQAPDSIWESMEISDQAKEQMMWENDLALRMGIIPTCTCAPFLNCDTGTFPKGSYISTIESSAIVYFNSVLGVRANRDCVASFFAAITGKYPECGLYLDQNRKATRHFDVQVEINDPLAYGLLGVYAGKICGKDTPVFTGLKQPKNYSLSELSAALASSGAVAMFHIVGVTPEAPDFDTATGGVMPAEKYTVTAMELMETYTHLHDGQGKVDFICMGCPHYSIYELAQIADMLENKKVHKDVSLWICTSPATAAFADMAGYSQKIRKSGATIMSGPNFCPLFGPGKPCPEYSFGHSEYSVGNFATDAVKQAFYAKPNLRAKKVFLGSREQCIDAAVSGYWKGSEQWKKF